MKAKYARLIVSLMIFISFSSVVAFSEANGTINVTTTVIGLYGYIKANNSKYHPCSSNADCYSNNCAADYTGSKYCADTNVCVHRLSGDTLATNYKNGDYGPDCKDSTHNWKCDNGVWVAHACSSGNECKNGNCVKKENSTQQSQYTNEMWVCKNSTHKAFMNYKGELTNITFCSGGCDDGKCIQSSSGSENNESTLIYNMTFVNMSSAWISEESVEKMFYVYIKNNGNIDLSVKLNTSGCDCKVTPSLLQIPVDKTKMFIVDENETKFGKKTILITAYSGSLKITKTITLIVNPNNNSVSEINDTLKNISLEIQQLKADIEEKKRSGYDVQFAEINMGNLEKNLNTTKELIGKGDYIDAYNILSDMKSSIERTKNVINSSDKKKSSGWVWFVVIFLIVGVSMVGAYVFWPKEHGYKRDVGYIPRTEENKIVAFLKELKDKYKRWRMMKKLENEEKKFKYRYKS